MRWLEVELTVSGELAEPISELLSRYSQGGVALATDEASEEQGSSDLVHVRSYLADGPNLAANRAAIERGLWHLDRIQPLPEPSYRFIEDQDWSAAWKANYRPIEVGRRLLIRPSWLESEPTDRLVVRIDPGMAFGTGTHPSTLLCLQLLEDWLEPDQIIVDLGSGSGILSIAGLLLGASRAFAYDIADRAVEAAEANAKANGVSERLVIQRGSLEELLAAVQRGLEPDLILANILAPILDDMLASGLATAMEPGAALILSGILADQVDGIQQAASARGLRVVEERAQGDWHALVLKHDPPR